MAFKQIKENKGDGMQAYLYRAIDLLTQKRVKGELQGENEGHIRKLLAQKNLYPIAIKEKNLLNRELTLFRPCIKLTDINFFCKQFAAMIQAGISVAKSLEICVSQVPNKTLSRHLSHIYDGVREGKSFSKAIEEEKIFPELLVHLIYCGEASGNLAEAMKRSTSYFDKQLTLRKKVKKALVYPSLVMVIITIVVAILMIQVVPNYISLLNDTGVEVPVPTQIVIAVSHFCVNYWGILLTFIASMSIGILNMKKISCIKRTIDYLSLKLFLIGKLNKKSLSATFSSTMSMLLESGLTMLQAMEITKKVMGNAVAVEEMNEAIEKLREGSSLLEAIGKSTIFSELLLSMVNVGEASGTLEEMLVKINEFYKEEVESAVDQLIVLIEPAMIIMVSIIIGGIMAAIMLPTFSAATAVM